jgi:Predicted membrane protein
MFKNLVVRFDQLLIVTLRKVTLPVARVAIFVVYFWFGILKVLELSPASPLVIALLDKTMPFMGPETFLICFGVFEVVIGVLFLIPRLGRLALLMLFIHLITTVMPLFLLSSETWSQTMVPTLEGQYIIKNVLIVALAVVVISNLQPWRTRPNTHT